jgi:hypothetical protein
MMIGATVKPRKSIGLNGEAAASLSNVRAIVLFFAFSGRTQSGPDQRRFYLSVPIPALDWCPP